MQVLHPTYMKNLNISKEYGYSAGGGGAIQP